MTERLEPVAETVARRTVRLERVLDAPVEKVWPFIIDGEKRARWFMGGPTDPHADGMMTLTIDHDSISPEPGEAPDWYKPHAGTSQQHRIIAIDPPRRLQFDWNDGSVVTFTLEPFGNRTRFVILHEGLKDGAEMAGVSGGWHTHSFVLAEVVAGRTPANFWKLHAGVDALYAHMKEAQS